MQPLIRLYIYFVVQGKIVIHLHWECIHSPPLRPSRHLPSSAIAHFHFTGLFIGSLIITRCTPSLKGSSGIAWMAKSSCQHPSSGVSPERTTCCPSPILYSVLKYTSAFDICEEKIKKKSKTAREKFVFLERTRIFLVGTRNFLVITRNFLVQTRKILVVTRNFLVLTRIFLVGTRIFLVGTRNFLVGTRIFLVQTRKILVRTRNCQSGRKVIYSRLLTDLYHY